MRENNQLEEGSILQNGKYVIRRVLGQGGFGITYLAEHTMLDIQVAIKEFFPKSFCDREEDTNNITPGTSGNRDLVDKFKAKFIKEARNIAKLKHPGIVRIQDVFEENNTAYYVMDYIEGHSLAEIIKGEGPIDINRAIGLIASIGNALEYIHSQKMNHFDIKPSNIMLSGKNQPILIDFGLAKQYNSEGDETSTTPIGISHGYAPPEQYKKDGVNTFSPQSDIYALGATLYKLLTGNTPPDAFDLIEHEISFPPYLKDRIKNAIKQAMSTNKLSRPKKVLDFIKLLNDDSCDEITDNTIIADNTNNQQKVCVQSTVKKKSHLKLIVSTTAIALLIIGALIVSTTIQRNANDSIAINKEANTDLMGIEGIDINLSVEWANMNVGASNPYEYGEYFSITPSSIEDIKNRIRSTLGDEWRLPTVDELIELLIETEPILKQLNNVKFVELLRSGDSKQEKVIIPYAGWKDFGKNEFATLGSCSFKNDEIYTLTCHPEGNIDLFNGIYYQMPVRLVRNKTKVQDETHNNNAKAQLYDLIINEHGEIRYWTPTEWLQHREIFNQNSEIRKLGVVFDIRPDGSVYYLGLNSEEVSTNSLNQLSLPRIPTLSQAKSIGSKYRKLNLAMQLYGGTTLRDQRLLISEKTDKPLEYSPYMQSLTGCGYTTTIRSIGEIRDKKKR